MGRVIAGLQMLVGTAGLQHVAFDGDLGVCAEVNQQPELAVRDAEVVQNLPPVFIGESVHGFEFQDDQISFGLILRSTLCSNVRGEPKNLNSECVIGSPFWILSSSKCKVQIRSAT